MHRRPVSHAAAFCAVAWQARAAAYDAASPWPAADASRARLSRTALRRSVHLSRRARRSPSARGNSIASAAAMAGASASRDFRLIRSARRHTRRLRRTRARMPTPSPGRARRTTRPWLFAHVVPLRILHVGERQQHLSGRTLAHRKLLADPNRHAHRTGRLDGTAPSACRLAHVERRRFAEFAAQRLEQRLDHRADPERTLIQRGEPQRLVSIAYWPSSSLRMKPPCSSAVSRRRIVLLYSPVRRDSSASDSRSSVGPNARRIANARSSTATPLDASSAGESSRCRGDRFESWALRASF